LKFCFIFCIKAQIIVNIITPAKRNPIGLGFRPGLIMSEPKDAGSSCENTTTVVKINIIAV
jgi:hypothetical protein